jgi:hypothetical protein
MLAARSLRLFHIITSRSLYLNSSLFFSSEKHSFPFCFSKDEKECRDCWIKTVKRSYERDAGRRPHVNSFTTAIHPTKEKETIDGWIPDEL